MILQLAMMADSSRDVHSLVEVCDRSKFYENELPTTIEECECILEHLFEKGQCLRVPGMTGLMVIKL